MFKVVLATLSLKFGVEFPLGRRYESIIQIWVLNVV